MMRTDWKLAAVVMTAALAGGCGPGGEDHPNSSTSGGRPQGGSSSSSSSSGSGSSSGHACDDVLCDMYCEAGFKTDANGCYLCECNDVTPRCQDIRDEASCSANSGCVVVYVDPTTGDAPNSNDPPQERPVAPQQDFRCCTVAADGSVQCDDVVEPSGCYSDSDCGDGYRCDFSNTSTGCAEPTDSDGNGGAPIQCLVAREGQCVPAEDACWGAWLDENGTCRTPADGVYPAECCGVTTVTCFSDSECGSDEYCELNSCGAGEAPSDGNSDRVACIGYCAKREVPVTCFSDSDCSADNYCEIAPDCSNTCGTRPSDGNGDQAPCFVQCQGQCVPREQPTTSCLSDDECNAGYTCDVENYCDSGCGAEDPNGGAACLAVCYGRCVPATTEPGACAAVECAPGTTCEVCSDAEDCVTKCVTAPQDECARLDEGTCALDFDLCEPVYATACPACEGGACDVPCQTSYVGCQKIPG